MGEEAISLRCVLTVLTADTGVTFRAETLELIDTLHTGTAVRTWVAQTLVVSCKKCTTW